MAASTEKDAETMTTQKIFKGRVRARMTKTGESYTAARRQLLAKAGEPPTIVAEAPAAPDPIEEPTQATAPEAPGVSDDAMRRATGKGHDEWFALLDAWGATEHTHTEIARWLSETQGVPSWWTQSVTVDYERARGMRSRHQMADGFSVSATRTIEVDGEQALAAFTDPAIRRRWLPDADLHQRPTRAALTARFDWSEPSSRIVVSVVPKGSGRAVVAIAHERLPDAETAARLKTAWRESLARLKALLEPR